MILGIHFTYISCCYVGQTSEKLSGCQEQPLLKWYACIKIVNRSIGRHWILKISEYSLECQKPCIDLQNKVHGDLECFLMCNLLVELVGRHLKQTKKIKENMAYILGTHFLIERCWILKWSECSSNARSHLQKKIHGDLECLQVCHTTFHCVCVISIYQK